jgi:hypothetical protein
MRVEMKRNKNWPSLFLIMNIAEEHISHEERSMNNQERDIDTRTDFLLEPIGKQLNG